MHMSDWVAMVVWVMPTQWEMPVTRELVGVGGSEMGSRSPIAAAGRDGTGRGRAKTYAITLTGIPCTPFLCELSVTARPLGCLVSRLVDGAVLGRRVATESLKVPPPPAPLLDVTDEAVVVWVCERFRERRREVWLWQLWPHVGGSE
jgi:hypothetical protein